MAAAAVQGLLDALGHTQALDAELCDYIGAVLEDPEDQESTLDVITGVLAESVPAFAALGSEEQARMVLKLLDDVRCLDDSQPSPAAAANQHNTAVHAMVAAIRQVSLQQHASDPGATHAPSSSSSGRFSSSSSGGDSPPAAHLGSLLELCPPAISHQFVQQRLRHFQGDVEATADWLLETGHEELLRLHDVWQEEQRQQEEQRVQEEHSRRMARKLIVDKFDLSVVSDSSGRKGGGGRQGGPDLLLASKKAAAPESKLRYRDGRVVSTKGERVIIEKVGEDWDGGSRGKVYTKGKRGIGYH